MSKRNHMCLATAVALLIVGTAIPTPGKGPACSDVPVRVTMYNVADPAGINRPCNISGDGKGEYINKVDGVSAVIKVCDGTNSTVWATGSRRKFTFNFPLPLDGSTDQPPFVGQGPFLASGWINVHNITYNYGTVAGDYQPFRTRMGGSFTYQRTTYGLGFFPPDADLDAPDTHPPPPELIRGLDSPVTVYPQQPFACPGPNNTTKPSSWLVKGNTTNSNGDMQVTGVFEMPFEFVIEALKCY